MEQGQVEQLLESIKEGKLPTEKEAVEICTIAKDIYKEEPNILSLSTPITVCGDIHGQYLDMMELFRVGGDIATKRYLFMGDFVDRGLCSVETFLYLMLLKVSHPDRISLIRGNHESRQITQVYGFYDECVRKYGNVNVWRACAAVFDVLSLCAIIDNKIFCVHGGLSPETRSVDTIRQLSRFQEIPHDGPISDLLWSDPDDQISGWGLSPRGAGYVFGGDIVEKFNRTNNFDLICRAHQLVNEGYKWLFQNTMVTIWSAPNYCGRSGNVAAILELSENDEKTMKIFDAVPDDNKQPLPRITPDYFL